MAISTFYLNGISLESATSIWLNAEMTLLAPDGFYQSGDIVRELSGGVLLPPQVCASCAFPCGDYPIDGGGEEGVYKMSMNVGSGTGAIIITVNPDNIPSGFSCEFDSATYNQFSSPTYGYLAATSGATYLGRTADDCGIVSGSPYSLDVYQFNGTTFDLTADTEIFSVVSSQIETTTNGPGNCVMVIPKPLASPTTLELTIYSTCPYGAFTAEISCPALLTALPSPSTVRFGDSVSACAATKNQTYYIAHVNGAGGTPAVYDWIFSDAYGQSPLADGYYASNSTVGWYRIENGVVQQFGFC